MVSLRLLAAALLYSGSVSSTSAFAQATNYGTTAVQQRRAARPFGRRSLPVLSESAGVVVADESSSSWFHNQKVAAAATKVNNNVNVNQAAVIRTLCSTTLFILMDLVFKSIFKTLGISFPSSLAGCGVLFSLLLVLPSSMGDKIYKVLKPGAGLLAQWLQVFLVPSLVRLPLAPALGSTVETTKVAAIIFGGFYVSLVMTAYSVLGIRKVVRPNNTNTNISVSEKETTPGVKNTQARTVPQPQPPYSDNLAKRLRIATITTGVAASMLSKTSSLIATTPLVSAFMLFSTMNNFVFGSRLPAKFKKVCHPLVVCTTLTWLSAHLLSWTTGLSFLSLIHGYKTGSLNILTGGGGAGDLFLFCLGPAITSFAVSMYEKRQLMRDNMAEVGTSILVASISGLFGTAALTRLFGLAKIASLSLLSRHITSALAMVTGSILGADISLTVSIAILTGLLGANFGASILDFWRIKCPVARGLAIGAASHGLGTAAISHEKDAFPFAAIAMTLVASFSAVLVSIPPIKIALVKLALGGA